MKQLQLVMMVLVLAIASGASAVTWYVPSAGCPTIQAGIGAAGANDTVLVAAGIYTGVGNTNLDFGGTNLVLLSEAGAEMTIIDCERSYFTRGFYFHRGETGAAVLEGFTIRNGRAFDPEFEVGEGGGIRCVDSSPTIRFCTFSGNHAAEGGGLYCYHCSPTISNCTFSNNIGYHVGGGIWHGWSSLNVSGCTFSGNHAMGYGGGMYGRYGWPGNPTISNCTFSENSAECGGGMYSWDDRSPHVSNCTFSGNSAEHGGGMYCYDDRYPTISYCTFCGNEAGGAGGGMYCQRASPTVRNCTFSGNCADGDGGGVRSSGDSHPLIENTIIAFSSQGEGVSCEGGSDATLTCCDVYGNAGGDYVGCIAGQLGINDNLSTDPLFCDTPSSDFTLDCLSPCAPAQQPECRLIGAWDIGCGASRTAATTWGAIKSMYR